MKHFVIAQIFLLVYSWALTLTAGAQSTDNRNGEVDLLADLAPEGPVRNYAAYTFKSTRIINTHSIENVAAGVLDFRIMHRFGAINGGWYELWGLDQAGMRMSLDYGVTPWLTVGGGRTNVGKAYDGFLKIKILRQSSGSVERPVSVSLVSGGIASSLRWDQPERKNYFTSRLTYYHQLLIARKISEEISLQLTPTMLHRNLVASPEIPNDLWALGTGGRLKLSSRVSANLDYIWLPKAAELNVRNNLSLGVDIETGGHVFQLHVSNGRGLNEGQFIAGSVGNWNDGTVYFGFNLSRVFTVREPRALSSTR
ncbi:MAG: hypothetical protein EBQ67_04050 [Sphingobacteriia bacterium]|jgi:hypothetical protein|nr:hypothetical protein [Sphingobacteriia bacterium]